MLRCMRTTLTLDDDVAALLNRIRERQGKGLKEIVNEALRIGLEGMTRPPRTRVGYRARPVSLGRCRIASLDDVAAALTAAEGEGHR